MLHLVAASLGAFLLFSVQPLLGKALLPWFGGSSAVWTTSMLFFQAALLAGYLYAHALARRLDARAQGGVHLLALGLAALALCARGGGLPTVLPDSAWRPAPEQAPALRVLLALGAAVGGPAVVLAATAPLVHAWYARAGGAAPYRLYAGSNLGSFLALLGYPFLVEPLLDVPAQARAWGLGFLAWALCCAACARAARAAGPAPEPPPGPAPASPSEAPPEAAPAARPGDVALWVALPAASTALLIAITSHLTEDVASAPFLWVLPLALYLLTFVVAFERDRWYARGVVLPGAALAALALAWALLRAHGPEGPPGFRLAAALDGAALALLGLACHGELARLRPPAARASGFYLALAAGGALGGALVALGAPLAFATRLELPLALVAAGALPLLAWARDPAGALARARAPRRRVGLALGLGACAALGVVLALDHARWAAASVEVSRNFYGTLRVFDQGGVRWLLVHGVTGHGAQPLAGDAPPLLYYGPTSGVGRAFAAAQAERPPGGPGLRVGLVGLGVGALADYGRPGDLLRFYELDPDVLRVARARFTHLARCRARVEVALGDARLVLEREPPQAFDLLVLDAFSSDAVPLHLLTAEAFAGWARHLAPGGRIALHVTNRSLELQPAVEATAALVGLQARTLEEARDARSLRYRSVWVVLARDPALLVRPPLDAPARPAPFAARPWTDARTSLLEALR